MSLLSRRKYIMSSVLSKEVIDQRNIAEHAAEFELSKEKAGALYYAQCMRLMQAVKRIQVIR